MCVRFAASATVMRIAWVYPRPYHSSAKHIVTVSVLFNRAAVVLAQRKRWGMQGYYMLGTEVCLREEGGDVAKTRWKRMQMQILAASSPAGIGGRSGYKSSPPSMPYPRPLRGRTAEEQDARLDIGIRSTSERGLSRETRWFGSKERLSDQVLGGSNQKRAVYIPEALAKQLGLVSRVQPSTRCLGVGK
ncbi:hypothetical protein FB451DRAFT_1177830 [Mycena latifolia]|nr:hypothetical protein FB451DRAFT_1177830 [Mycena latifolia]